VSETCFLAAFSEKPCEGRLRKVHLLPKQRLKRAGLDPWDERSWVWACGGEMGIEGHHGELDGYKLTIPPDRLPLRLIELAEEHQLLGYLHHRYGYEAAA